MTKVRCITSVTSKATEELKKKKTTGGGRNKLNPSISEL